MFRKEYNEELKKLDLYNFHEYEAEPKEFIPLEIEEKEYDSVLIELGLNVLKPINNGEDFIYTFAGTSFVKGLFYDFDSLVGLSFGDLYQFARDELYPIFNEVLATGKKEIFRISMYNEDELFKDLIMRIIPHDDEIYFFFNDRTEFSTKLTNLIKENASKDQELINLKAVIDDVQEGANLAVFYLDADGKWHYPDEAYDIIERDPRPDDEDRTIFADLMPPNINEKWKNVSKSLKPGETYYDEEEFWPITLESGKVKYLKGMARLIYDDEGNFVRKSYYAQDVTEEYLKNQELLSLNAVIDDIQESANLAVFYLDADGKWHYPDEAYDIIERDPRSEDADRTIFADLLSSDLIDKKNKITESLKLGETYIGKDVWPITLENGKVKYLRGMSRSIYDENGHFIRKSEFAQDVTDEYLRQFELDKLLIASEHVQIATKTAIHFVDNNGKYHWTPEVYTLLEREPRPDDVNHHIFHELMDKEDVEWVINRLDKLEPDEFLGNMIFKITLENGKTKYIQTNSHMLYDNKGDFIQRNAYTQDITDYYNLFNELNILNTTFEDVQVATLTSISYVDADGKYHWTPETYELIERDPRPDDGNIDIILDLASEKCQQDIKELTDNLELDEYSDAHLIKITTGSGNEKYLKRGIHKISDDNGDYLRTIRYTTDVTEDYIQNREILSLNKVVKDVEEVAALVIYYMDADGKWHYSDEAYEILEREPRPEDKDTHIFRDLMSDICAKKYDNMINSLKPNEKYDKDEYWPITLESGKVKYLKGTSRLIYDDEGNFLRRSGFVEDATEEYLKNKEELMSLHTIVEDMQKSAEISIQYMDAEGKYHWTEQTYHIIDREPREGDEDKHIIRELMSNDEIKFFDEEVSALGPGDFYNENKMWPITTESGKIKYLKGNARNIYDEDGNFLRRSEFVQDITEDYLRNQEFRLVNAVVDDVEEIADIAIYYMDSEGKWHYPDEIYNIIEREPRKEDEDINIFRELMPQKYVEMGDKILASLKPGELYDKDIYWPITLENGKLKYIKSQGREILDDNGNFICRSEYAQDVTSQVIYENKLIQADKDKTVLVQEVHHRVKNNLQMISSFINLEKKFHKDDPERIIKVTEDRINSLALIHERIYNEEDMNYIKIAQFLKDFDNNLFVFSLNEDIEFIRDIDEDLTLSIDIVTPLTLMINELTLNVFKYAFNEDLGRDKVIYKSIKLFEEDNVKYCEFKFSDNGIGLPDDYNILKSPSLGWKIIVSLIEQLDGEYKLFNDNGLNFTLKFPLK